MAKTLLQIFEENNLIPERDIIRERINLKQNKMKLNEMIKMMAEKHAYFDGEQMDSTSYFSFIAGARYALQLIAKEINDDI